MIALHWGRFNPPHRGHLSAIKKILSEADELIIAVGSAEERDTERNPFDGEERKRMIEAYLAEEGMDASRVRVIPVPDGKSIAGSVRNLFSLCGDFDVLYTDKESIISAIGKKAAVRRIRRSGTVSSTGVRKAIVEGRSIAGMTGKSVIALIEKFDGEKRIREAYVISDVTGEGKNMRKA